MLDTGTKTQPVKLFRPLHSFFLYQEMPLAILNSDSEHLGQKELTTFTQVVSPQHSQEEGLPFLCVVELHQVVFMRLWISSPSFSSTLQHFSTCLKRTCSRVLAASLPDQGPPSDTRALRHLRVSRHKLHPPLSLSGVKFQLLNQYLGHCSLNGNIFEERVLSTNAHKYNGYGSCSVLFSTSVL